MADTGHVPALLWRRDVLLPAAAAVWERGGVLRRGAVLYRDGGRPLLWHCEQLARTPVC